MEISFGYVDESTCAEAMNEIRRSRENEKTIRDNVNKLWFSESVGWCRYANP